MAVNKKNSKKESAVAFVNWAIAGGKIRSTKGFTVFDNEYTTKSDRTLIELAKQNGGTVKVKAELTIVLNTQSDDQEIDLSEVEIITD